MTSTNTHLPPLTLVIDQGSHASRIAVFTQTGELIYLKSQTIATHTKSGISSSLTYEQDANEILSSIRQLLNNIPENLLNNIHCCSLCTQRSTIVAWHKTSGDTLSPAISWQDTRAHSFIETLRPFENDIKKITGLLLSAHYSASKIHWLLNNNATVKQAKKTSQLRISPLASYLLFHLLNEKPYLIDHSNAQRCQLFDIQQLKWSNKLLELFNIQQHILPRCAPVINLYGHLYKNNIPLTAVVGDQNAALYAFPALHNNTALVNIGTGAFILSPVTDIDPTSKLLRTLASSNAEQCHFVSEGTVNGAGAALSWAQQVEANDNSNSDNNSDNDSENDSENNIFTQLPGWLTQVSSPPIFINTVSGLGSPWWCNHAGEAIFLGIKNPSQAQRYVAIIESIVFLIVKNIEQLSIKPDTLFISGGLSKLDDLCHKLADCSQIKVLRFNTSETTARGCAWLANRSLKNNHLGWEDLHVSKQFFPSIRPSKAHPDELKIRLRYEQFVGELYKRCQNG